MGRNVVIGIMALLALCGGAFAQGGPGGGQMPQLSPAVQAHFKKMRAWSENHKAQLDLLRTFNSLGQLEKDGRAPLSKEQAKKVLGIMKPLKNKKKLSADEAKNAMRSLKKVLTIKQLNELDRLAQQRRGGGMMGGGNRPGGGPGGGPGGAQGNRQGGPGGSRDPGDWQKQLEKAAKEWNDSAMKDFNPFYSKNPTTSPMMQRGRERQNAVWAALEKKT